MVSKSTRKTLTKASKHSPKATRRRPGKSSPSPLKTLTSAATNINRSLRSCRRRLVKIFASISIFHTPNNKRKHGFRRLSPTAENMKWTIPPPASIPTLPPPSTPGQKIVFLDLDETLIHSCARIPPYHSDFTVRPKIDGQEINFYVLKRPGAEELLRAAAESFEVVIFTAGLKEYASLVLDKLDPEGAMISHRLYRDSCREAECGRLMKDLSGLGRDLRKVVIVDDNPASYALQKENAVPVAPFIDDPDDRELLRVIEFLEIARHFEDMRNAVNFFLSGESKIAERVNGLQPLSSIPTTSARS